MRHVHDHGRRFGVKTLRLGPHGQRPLPWTHGGPLTAHALAHGSNMLGHRNNTHDMCANTPQVGGQDVVDTIAAQPFAKPRDSYYDQPFFNVGAKSRLPAP